MASRNTRTSQLPLRRQGLYTARKVRKSEALFSTALEAVSYNPFAAFDRHMSHRGILEPEDSKKTDSSAEDTHLLLAVHVFQKEIDEDGVGDDDHFAVLW